jgi:hypothetical protein
MNQKCYILIYDSLNHRICTMCVYIYININVIHFVSILIVKKEYFLRKEKIWKKRVMCDNIYDIF